ncbi:MAG TPA: hypothetical protein PLK61_09055 [Nitrosomonas sp.]|nr:hypothetical protein [Nitrosomonas sp.]
MVKLTSLPMTDTEAAKFVAHTHSLSQQEDERPEDFVLRIVRAYDHAKSAEFGGRAGSAHEQTKE